jgi:hypothetical protein
MSEFAPGVGGLFPGASGRLAGQPFGTKIKDGDGHLRDTNVQPAVEEILAVLKTGGPVTLTEPIELVYTGQGAPLRIRNEGPDAHGIDITARYDGAVELVRIGVGGETEGLVANDVRPARTALDPYGDRSGNTLADILANVLTKFFGTGCCANGEPYQGQDCLEQLAENGHSQIPNHDRTKKQLLWHDENSDCLRWLTLDADGVCTILKIITSGYDASKVQVLGHDTSGTCKWYDVGDCA